MARSDADVTKSRKMGTYYMATLLFKVYFQLKSTALCKNIIRGIKAANLAPFEAYPVAHRTTYLYYMGVFAFLREDYGEAEASFIQALNLIHKKASRNIESVAPVDNPCAVCLLTPTTTRAQTHPRLPDPCPPPARRAPLPFAALTAPPTRARLSAVRARLPDW